MPRTTTRKPFTNYDPDATRAALGDRLRGLRKEQNLTQAALAARAGIGNEFISRLEHGHGSPSLDTLGKLASALRVPISELFEFGHEKTPAVRDRRLRRALEQLDDEGADLAVELVEQQARFERKRTRRTAA